MNLSKELFYRHYGEHPYHGQLNYDDTDEIADNVPAKAGLLVVQKHFSKGMAEPSYLYIKSTSTSLKTTNTAHKRTSTVL